VACAANIVLDYLFMGALKLGPAGAALGTTISQAISVLVSLIVIIKRKSIVLAKTDFRPHRPVMGKILSIGIPIAVQDGLLHPEYTSPDTGYRYYGTEQFEVLNTIRYLRALDMPLDTVTLERSPASRIVWMDAPLKIVDSQDMEAPIRELDQSQAEAVVFLGKVGLGISSEHLQAPEQYKKILEYIENYFFLDFLKKDPYNTF